GEKSANVTLRKLFETYANVRPARELPGVPTRYAGEGVDMVIVRENVEDLYAGIEHMETPDVGQCLKVISRKGSEKVIRYAFELARREGRAKVTAATKANIMKLTEGLFKKVFEELALEYPEITSEHLIIDNVAHQLAKQPSQFDIIVTTNLNGDIISDLASGLVGGLGFASSGNYGDTVAIFEAVHGSAPKYAGRDMINPTALILSSVMMLRHLGEATAAARVEDAVLVTLEEGTATTQDLVRQTGGDVDMAASTTGFTDAVIGNLGRGPATLKARRPVAGDPGAGTRAALAPLPAWSYSPEHYAAIERRTIGLDIFIETADEADRLGPELEAVAAGGPFELHFIESRGTKVYPSVGLSSDGVRLLRARFLTHDGGAATEADLLALQGNVAARQPGWTHVEKLHVFNGADGFTKAQGE
ncbi:MAG: isocitrate/isopropylmalate family dehydrogenase, partial [Candidatus Limnocylindrales bacterium]